MKQLPFQKKSQFRFTFLAILLIIVMLLYSARIYNLQITASQNNDILAGTKKLTAVLKAPRGEILDYYGRQIAVNRDGYNIVFNKARVGSDLNDVILSLITLMQEHKTEWIDSLPLENAPPYSFKEGESTAKLIKLLKLAHYATAENCFTRMVEKYKLEAYPVEQQRLIMGVRYSMDIADFSISYPYTFAEDIPTELMRKVSEGGFMYSGVTVDVVPFREYVDTTLAVNLIGEVGPIYEEDWEKYKKKGYSYNDKVGKSGIEYWAEEYLHGIDGEMTYYIDEQGKIVQSKVTREPIAGKTVMLTLDKSIQRTAQNSLERIIKELQSKGGTAVAGSAVMIDIDTGGIICGANYPTYDSSTMHENYAALSADPLHPLTNRAFQGVYPIGSTIKPIVAMAALDNSQYKLGETIRCVHTYRLFADYQPSCMGYHGSIPLKTALAKSCNYFFFELGRRVGAITLTDYFKQFGLGVKTGVEVDDSAGLLMEPTSNGLGGDTLQISIGQMNAFTPLQLASYAATLSNGGTRYRTTLIDSIVSYDLSTVYKDQEPEVLNKLDINPTSLAAIKEGMLSVTVDGTGRTVFADYPIKIGGKTGTSQINTGADHSTYIVFAPYENPQIAISVILEHGSSGYSAGTIIKEMLDAYFFADGNKQSDTPPFAVLQ